MPSTDLNQPVPGFSPEFSAPPTAPILKRGLLRGSDSTIPGFTTMTFDLQMAIQIVKNLVTSGYQYGLGSKIELSAAQPPHCLVAPGQHNPSCDCSALQRYLVYRCSGITIPDGSFTEDDWYRDNGFKHTAVPAPNSPVYADMNPAFLYSCFCRTGTRGEKIGHVWFSYIVNNVWMTLESHGGRGPDSRPRDTPVLKRIVTDIYPVAKIH